MLVQFAGGRPRHVIHIRHSECVCNTLKFVEMKEGDIEDYTFLRIHGLAYAAQTAGRLMHALEALEDSMTGYQVSRLTHSLQSATRAHRDGADIDWVVSALLHDIADA